MGPSLTSVLPKLRLGVSACLLGEEVRYDGGHKREAWLVDELDAYVEWVPLCPEVEMGLSTPRPTLQLVMGDHGEPRLYMPATDEDLSQTMADFAEARLEGLATEGLAGYILKSKSPSCGLRGIEIQAPLGGPVGVGRGLFAEALLGRWPQLPVEEESGLRDGQRRASYLWRIFARAAWLQLQDAGFGPGALMAFHRRHELLLMAYGHGQTQALAKLLTDPDGADPPGTLADRYLTAFNQILCNPVTVGGHIRALKHAKELVSGRLDPGEGAQLSQEIVEFREGRVPLRVPLGRLHDHGKRLQLEFLEEQVYLRLDLWALAAMGGD